MNVTLHDETMLLLGNATLPDSAVPPELITVGTVAYIHVTGFSYRRSFLTPGQVVAMPGDKEPSEDPAP